MGDEKNWVNGSGRGAEIRKWIIGVLYKAEGPIAYKALIAHVKLLMGGDVVTSGYIDNELGRLVNEGVVHRREQDLTDKRGFRAYRALYEMDPVHKLATIAYE